jgi:hypothetical protein
MLKRLGIATLPPRIIVLSLCASALGVAGAKLQGWPPWGCALAGIIPIVPVLAMETAWSWRHYGWLALYFVLVVTQLGHVGEHVAQVVQIHVLHRMGPGAKGIFGALDIEWVHFVWNTWIIIAVGLLLLYFRHNPWLWATLALAAWHEVEHGWVLSTYLRTGMAGSPGLLAKGGAVGGGLWLVRPDLHFIYNVIETIPLVAGFIYQVAHTYDEWWAKALPSLSRSLLLDATRASSSRRYDPGESVIVQGEPAAEFFVISKGEAEVTRDGLRTRTLKPGDFFGEIGLLRASARTATVNAKTSLEVLALDDRSFRDLVARSASANEELESAARERLARDGLPAEA